jgi:hypothetical protein
MFQPLNTENTKAADFLGRIRERRAGGARNPSPKIRYPKSASGLLGQNRFRILQARARAQAQAQAGRRRLLSEAVFMPRTHFVRRGVGSDRESSPRWRQTREGCARGLDASRGHRGTPRTPRPTPTAERACAGGGGGARGSRPPPSGLCARHRACGGVGERGAD